MTNKIWNGSAWKEFKNLRIWNGSAWKDTTKGWVWNGSAWKQWYPEYPVNTVAPTVSGNATQGNTLSVTDGSWKGFPSDKAFSYNQTAYQWLRNGVNISGATANQYSTVVADVGNAISCRVTVTNNRGQTPATSSNSITVTSAIPGPPSNLSITSSTATPGVFSVSGSSSASTPTITMGSNSGVTSSAGTINWTSTNQSSYTSTGTFSGSGTTGTSISKTGLSPSTTYTGTVTVTGPGSTTASGSWDAATNTSSYSVSTNAATLSSNTTNRTWSLSSGTTGGSYTITVTATNTSGSASISWSAGSNATSYDIYINGSYWTNTTSTSITYNWGTTGSLSVNVRSRNSAGAETTGVSGSQTISSTTRSASSSGTFASANTASANYSLQTSAAPNLTAPSITSVPNITSGAALYVYFSGGSGPYYQIWWQGVGSGSDYSGVSGYDAYSSSSPVIDATGPTALGNYYVGIRSVSVQDAYGTGPSPEFSSWTVGSFSVGDSAPASAPTGIVATRYTSTACLYTSIYWNAVSGATTYDVWRTTSSTATPTSSTTPSATYPSTAADGASDIPNTAWDYGSSASAYYFVRASNSGGKGPWSSRITPGTSASIC